MFNGIGSRSIGDSGSVDVGVGVGVNVDTTHNMALKVGRVLQSVTRRRRGHIGDAVQDKWQSPLCHLDKETRLLPGRTNTDTDMFLTRLRLGPREREREGKDGGLPQHELNEGKEKNRNRGRSKAAAE